MPGGKKEDYDVLEDIGSGSFGFCQKIRRKSDGKTLAWKVIEYGGMSETEKQQLVKEVNLLREFRHHHIVRYYDRIIDKASCKLYILMEYCSGGDVQSLINRTKKERKCMEEGFIWRVMYQLSLALSECHRIRDDNGGKVLHRDIKPANVFIDGSGSIKLGDFGLARILHDTSLAKTFIGTPFYMSPEQFQCTSYDSKSDMWSLGCLLYEMCMLSPPFTACSERELMVKVCNGYFSRIPSHYSSELHATISSLLHVNPEKRPNVTTISSIASSHLTRAMIPPRPNSGSNDGENITAATDPKQKEQELKQREQALSEREKALHQREKELRRREKAVEKREQHLRMREREIPPAPFLPKEVDALEKRVARLKLPLKKKENIG